MMERTKPPLPFHSAPGDAPDQPPVFNPEKTGSFIEGELTEETPKPRPPQRHSAHTSPPPIKEATPAKEVPLAPVVPPQAVESKASKDTTFWMASIALGLIVLLALSIASGIFPTGQVSEDDIPKDILNGITGPRGPEGPKGAAGNGLGTVTVVSNVTDTSQTPAKTLEVRCPKDTRIISGGATINTEGSGVYLQTNTPSKDRTYWTATAKASDSAPSYQLEVTAMCVTT